MNNAVFWIYGGMLLIFALCVLSGYLRGFVKSMLSMAAVVLCVVVAREYCEAAAAWLNAHVVHQALVDALANVISKHVTAGAQAIVNALPAVIREAVGLSDFSLTEAAQTAVSTANVTAVAEQIAATAEQALLNRLLRIAAFVAIFLALRLAAAIVIAVIGAVFHLPGLKTVNRAVGAAFGAVKGLLWMLLFVLALAALSELLPETALTEAFAGSGLGAVSDLVAAAI